jgi:hypothetical protein
MNLQEALEALLDKRRELEGWDAEGLVASIHSALEEAEETPDDIEDEAGDLVASLVCIGGAVLALLATDYSPVVGRELDEWLKATENGVGGPTMVARAMGILRPSNGQIGPVRTQRGGGPGHNSAGTGAGTAGAC